MNKKNKYWLLFSRMFLISSFAFGGGYVVIPMIRQYFVEQTPAMTEEELLDMAAIGQSSPGAIAVNLSVLTGYHIGGMLGAIICAIATVLPPLIILSIISFFYQAFRQNLIVSAVLQGMEAGVVATIVSFIIDMFTVIVRERRIFFTIMIPAAFIASFVLQIPVPIILAVCIALSAGYTFIWQRKEAADDGIG